MAVTAAEVRAHGERSVMRPRVPRCGVCQAAAMTDPAPVRIERDGDVAVVVLDSPPLNLFDAPVFDAIEAVAGGVVPVTDPAGPPPARAARARNRRKHRYIGIT